MYSLRRKGALGDIMELSPMLKEIKKFKEKPDTIWEKETRERPHSAKLSNCERNGRKT